MEDTSFYKAEPDKMNRRKQKVLVQTSLYAPDCLTYLEQALEVAAGTTITNNSNKPKSRFASSSDEEEQQQEQEGHYESSGSEEEGSDPSLSEDEGKMKTTTLSSSSLTTTGAAAAAAAPPPPPPPVTTTSVTQTRSQGNAVKTPVIQKQLIKLEKLAKRQSDAQVRRHVDTLTCHNFQLPSTPSSLCLPSAVLSKDARLADHPSVPLQAFQQLAKDLQITSNDDGGGASNNKNNKNVVLVFFVRSGRLAGAVFVHGECVQHRTTTRYTVRKGQGKAQSAQDSQRRPKSIGSQLRRQGEEKLRQDITQTATDWKAYLDRAALILVSCPKTMKKSFYDSLQGLLSREDHRIRRVPLDLGRPTFENAVLIHDVLTTVTIRELVVVETKINQDYEDNHATLIAKDGNQKVEPAGPTDLVGDKKSPEDVLVPLSALHVACKNGDLEVIRELLATETAELRVMAGPDFMTPLHYAAECSKSVEPGVAADCVMELLTQGHADPTVLDGRGRPAYFLAGHERVRDAFRMARAILGEDYCSWDEEAKVGPALTPNDLQLRKEKEAEKRRKKKARQKQKKEQDKAAAEELEKRQQEEAEKARQVEEAKRIRDGLKPKPPAAGNVCDFCQTVCKGRKRSQMLKRLEYAYCSTECVQNHKRELMAKAALSRFSS